MNFEKFFDNIKDICSCEKKDEIDRDFIQAQITTVDSLCKEAIEVGDPVGEYQFSKRKKYLEYQLEDDETGPVIIHEEDKTILKPKNKVNVLYITTICNLRCDYCYELDKSSKKTATMEQIKEFFDEIAKREHGLVSTVVLMGGEPFIAMKRIEEALDYTNSLEHRFSISLVTNGTMIKMYNKDYYDKLLKKIVTLEISYDGSGQDRRIHDFTSLSSKPIVEDSLRYLKEIDIPFRISYTVHKDNIKNLLRDMVYIMEVFKPFQIKWSIACQELSDIGINWVKLKKDFYPYAEYLFTKYGIAICDVSCPVCNRCVKDNFEGNAYLSPTKGIFYGESQTQKAFDNF